MPRAVNPFDHLQSTFQPCQSRCEANRWVCILIPRARQIAGQRAGSGIMTLAPVVPLFCLAARASLSGRRQTELRRDFEMNPYEEFTTRNRTNSQPAAQ